jgi:hypothetical protein
MPAYLRKAKKDTLLQISQHNHVAAYAKSTGKTYSKIRLPLHTGNSKYWNSTTQIK